MTSRPASFAVPLAVTTATVMLVGAGGAWFGVLPPVAGLGVFALAAFVGGGASLTAGVLAARRARQRGSSAAPAFGAMVTGGACLLLIVSLIWRGAGLPPIHDITTDPDDPPEFVVARTLADNRDRNLDYPNGAADTAERQRDAYPDLRPIDTDAAPGVAYDIAREIAVRLGWRLINEDPGAGFEAVATTSLFRFRDDVVVRVRPTASGSVIDVRSTSRVGVGDLGANARRIRRFSAAVHEALDGRS